MTDPRTSAAIRAALKGYEPTDEQWAAIAHPLEPVYLIAGAGSGKTAVMAARIAWALETQPFSPDQVVGLTFTNKAADELLERIHLALAEIADESGEDVTVQTYNAFAAGIVRDHGLLVGIEPEAGLLSEAQQWQLLLSCLDDLTFEALEVRSPYVARSSLALASSVADHMVSLESIDAAADQIISMKGADPDMIEVAQKRKELVRAVAAYTKAKQRAGRIDFGDQISKAVEILEGNDEVRDSYRKRFPFVLLDEYQDTNVAQRRMLQALVGQGGAITAVGDARQAIFAWRGATMYNLIGFPDDFPRADGSSYGPVSLSENFRSGGNILAVANTVVERIDEARRPGDPLRAQADNGTGEVALALFSDERAEADWIASECERLHGTAMAVGRPEVAWKDIAILVRRKAAMDMLLQALEEKEIPVEVVGLGGLLKTPEVTEIVAWLRALESKPAANRWLARILLGPRWRIHFRDLSLLARWATLQNRDLRERLPFEDEMERDLEPGDIDYSLAEALNHVDEIEHLGAEATKRLKSFNARLAAMRKRSNAPLLELVQDIIRQAGILDALDSSSSRAAPAARQNISNFLDQVASFAPVEGEASLRSFIEYLDAADQAEETLDATQPADQDSVKLMTVHSAKGLEFECVFVPSVAAAEGKSGGKVWSIFPNTKGSNPLTSYSELPYEVREDAGHLPRFEGHMGKFKAAVRERVIEDERRLFYVALTRAKQRLAVSASWWYGRDKTPKGPSEFWEELEGLESDGLLTIVRRDDCPAENPLFDAMEDRRQWPPAARAGLDDPLFTDGWGRAADRAVVDDAFLDGIVATLSPEERARYDEMITAHRDDVALIAAAMGSETSVQPSVPEIVSATTFVNLKKGSVTAWDLVRPVPDRPTAERRLGTEVHRLIEEKARGVAPYADEGELDEPSQVTDPRYVTSLLDHFAASGYADRKIAELPSGELMVELPFTMRLNGSIVRGRIDAVYESADGGYEIVDFKTGRRFGVDEANDQLSLYASALLATGALDTGRPITLTYLFLDGEPPLTRPFIAP